MLPWPAPGSLYDTGPAAFEQPTPPSGGFGCGIRRDSKRMLSRIPGSPGGPLRSLPDTRATGPDEAWGGVSLKVYARAQSARNAALTASVCWVCG